MKLREKRHLESENIGYLDLIYPNGVEIGDDVAHRTVASIYVINGYL